MEGYGADHRSINRKKGKYYIKGVKPRIKRRFFIFESWEFRGKPTQSFPEIITKLNSKIFHLYSETLHCYRYYAHVPLTR